MSKGLGALFGMGGGGEDGGGLDSLKYSAPKEPKKAVAPTPAAKPAATASSLSSGSAVVASAPPKIIVSCAVRLYKMNASTRAYEAHEGGSPLGCIITGSGVTFTLAFYNSQKQYQAVVPITPKFQYTLQNMYVSFSDPQGAGWSALFDNVDTLANFQRMLLGTIAHVASHSSDAAVLDTLPPFFKAVIAQSTTSTSTPVSDPKQMQDSAGNQVVQLGCNAGIYYTIWEIGDLNNYPDEAVNASPIFSVKAPNDVTKINLKATGSEALFPGFADSLIGMRKLDKMLYAVQPKHTFATSESSSFGNNNTLNAGRKFLQNWIIVEVEIAKLKQPSPASSDSTKAASNDIDESSPTSSLSQRMANLANAGKPIAVDHRPAFIAESSFVGPKPGYLFSSGKNGTGYYLDASNTSSGSSVMAQMANVMRNQSDDHSSSNNSSTAVATTSATTASTSSNNNYNNSNNASQSNISNQNSGHNGNQNTNNSSNSGNNNNNYSPNNMSNFGSYDSNSNSQSNNNNNNNNNINGNQNQNQYNSQYNNNSQNNTNNPDQYSLTVVQGQESRSFFTGGGNFNNNRNNNNNPNNNNPNNNSYNNQNNSNSYNNIGFNNNNSSNNNNTNNNNQFQNPNAPFQNPPVFGMPDPMGAFGGGNNGAQVLMSLTQLHAKVDAVQMQLQSSAMVGGMGMNLGMNLGIGMGAARPLTRTGPVGGAKPFQMKGDEVMAMVKSFVDDYEQGAKDFSGGGGSDKQAEIISKLQDKLEALQEKNEKLVFEKTTLLEKQSDLFQAKADASSKLMGMQVEMDQLRRERSGLDARISDLQSAVTNSNSSAQASSQLEAEVASLKASLEQQKRSNQSVIESALASEAQVRALNDQKSAFQTEIDALKMALSQKDQALSSAQNQLQESLSAISSASNADPDLSHPSVKQLVDSSIEDDRRSQQAAMDNLRQSLENDSSLALAAKTSEINSLKSTIADLSLKLEEALASASSASSSSSGNGAERKETLQSVYEKCHEIFESEESDESRTYKPKEVMKRIKGVLKSLSSN